MIDENSPTASTEEVNALISLRKLIVEGGNEADQRETSREVTLERAKGIEPSYRAWEALVLPLNYARIEVRKGL